MNKTTRILLDKYVKQEKDRKWRKRRRHRLYWISIPDDWINEFLDYCKTENIAPSRFLKNCVYELLKSIPGYRPKGF